MAEPAGPGRVLVTGGVRSGKSRHAEQLLPVDAAATYVAAGPVYDDADWADRITRHRERRPAAWSTYEGLDVAAALAAAPGPVLVDCLGTWLTGVVDEAGVWEAPVAEFEAAVLEPLAPIVDAIHAFPHRLVVVTNEVGLGVVPEHRSGRLFRDLLGTVNQRVAEACDEVHLVVAGRVLVL